VTTNRKFDDSEGSFTEWEPIDVPCQHPGCNEPVKIREWDSSDGAYTDFQFRCHLGHTWWVDGIDS
jgi:hypothetical protein